MIDVDCDCDCDVDVVAVGVGVGVGDRVRDVLADRVFDRVTVLVCVAVMVDVADRDRLCDTLALRDSDAGD